MFSNREAWTGWGLTLLRIVVGVIFVVHGGQKLFQFGIPGVTQSFTQMGVPAASIAAIVVTIVEFIGGIALILGAGTRIVALLLAADMLVATLLVHMPNGFFVSDGGYEFTLLLLGASLALALSGPGNAAVDAMLRRRTTAPAH